MWWTFKNAAVRKLAYLIVGALFALLIGHNARADGPCYTKAAVAIPQNLTPHSGDYTCSTYQDCANQAVAFTNSQLAPQNQYPAATCTTGGAMTATVVSCPDGFFNFQVTPHVGACPCAGLPNMDIIVALKSNTAYGGDVGNPTMCVNGCSYTNSGNTLMIGGPKAAVYGQAVPTGSSCGTPSGMQGNCASGGGTTTCYDDSNGKAVINGDIVDKADMPAAGSCVQYPSGGTMCTYSAAKPLATPPAPSTDGTTVEEPAALVSAGGASAVTHGAYYSAGQNAASVNVVTGTSKANPTGGSSPGGVASGEVSVTPSPENGDCAASGVDCTSDGSTPSLTRADTVQSNVQGYIDSIKAAPLFTAFAGITNSWPSETACPTIPFTLYTKDFDAFAPVCSIWGTTVAPTLSLVFLAIWAVAGIRVVMSA